MISVIVPTYNQSRYLARAIESVWAQDLNDVEIVVVDDGSTDDTEAILEKLSNDGRLRYFRQGNLGPAAARNRGIRESRGELIAFLDSDDFWLPGKLKAQLDALARTGYRFSYCGSKVIDENGNLIALAPASTDDGRFINLVWGNRFATPTVLVQRSLLDEVGLFDESLRTGEDWDLWLRLSAKSSGACIPEPLVAVTGNQHWRADENQLRTYEHSISTVIARMFDLAANQQELTPVMARKNQIASWHFSVLAKSYLHERDFRRSLRWAVRCIARSPHGLIYLMPARRSQSVAGGIGEQLSPGEDVSRSGVVNPESSSAGRASKVPADFSVSVVIRTYNRASMLVEALDSALLQTLPAREIVVIDDGSTDDTQQVVASYQSKHPEIRYVRTAGNQGADRAARAGVEETRFPYVAFLDSDDLWLPHHLEEAATAFEANPGTVMAFSSYGLVNSLCETLVDRVKEPRLSDPPLRQLILKKVIVQPTRTVFARRAIFDVGGVPLFPAAEDWVLAVLLAGRFPSGVVQTNQRTVFFRVHGSQSYSRPLEVRKTLLEASEYLSTQVPVEFRTLKARVMATNLLHCAVFLWQSGNQAEAWRSLYRAVGLRFLSVITKEFWAAFLRLIVPPSIGRRVRDWKRSIQERRGRNSGAAPAATHTA